MPATDRSEAHPHSRSPSTAARGLIFFLAVALAPFLVVASLFRRTRPVDRISRRLVILAHLAVILFTLVLFFFPNVTLRERVMTLPVWAVAFVVIAALRLESPGEVVP